MLGLNLLDIDVAADNACSMRARAGPCGRALHSQMTYLADRSSSAFTYPLLPWIDVMLLGFGTASVFEAPPARRRMRLLASGIAAIVAFVVMRASGLHGDPNPWQADVSLTRTAIDFLNTTKNPPSMLFTVA